MARKPRIEFEGAVYHVFNHGHRRTDLFATAEAAQAFVECLGEAAARMQWRLHAYCLTRNQYHLALDPARKPGQRRALAAKLLWQSLSPLSRRARTRLPEPLPGD